MEDLIGVGVGKDEHPRSAKEASEATTGCARIKWLLEDYKGPGLPEDIGSHCHSTHQP